MRCVATQGRTSKPDSPNAPLSGSITATITGNVFWNEWKCVWGKDQKDNYLTMDLLESASKLILIS